MHPFDLGHGRTGDVERLAHMRSLRYGYGRLPVLRWLRWRSNHNAFGTRKQVAPSRLQRSSAIRRRGIHRLEAHAPKDRERRVLREARIGRGPAAEVEHRASAVARDPMMATRLTEADVRHRRMPRNAMCRPVSPRRGEDRSMAPDRKS